MKSYRDHLYVKHCKHLIFQKSVSYMLTLYYIQYMENCWLQLAASLFFYFCQRGNFSTCVFLFRSGISNIDLLLLGMHISGYIQVFYKGFFTKSRIRPISTFLCQNSVRTLEKKLWTHYHNFRHVFLKLLILYMGKTFSLNEYLHSPSVFLLS